MDNHGHQKKVLVIEDDQFVRDIYVDILKERHFMVDVAADGQEGLTKLLQGGYDIVLLDIMMPKMNGIQVLTELKKARPKPKLGPIIVLTNLAHDPVLKEAIDLGAHFYLIKSDLTPDEFGERVASFA